MPRKQQRPLTQRKPIDPQTTFDFTTPDLKVTARPVDPYVRPDKSGGLNQLLGALSSVNQSLNSYNQYLNIQKQKEYEQGQFSRVRGEEKPSISEQRIKGWEELDGQIKARQDYKTEVNEFMQNAQTMTPDEFSNGLEEIAKKYIAGAPDNFLRGFAENALSIEESAKTTYQKVQQELYHQESLNRLNVKADDEVKSTVEDILRETFSIDNLDDLAGNPMIYETLNHGNFASLFSNQLRTALSDAQKLGKQLGLDRNTISEIYLEKVGILAVSHGLPELLDFADKKDKSGISIAGGLLGAKVEQYKKSAQTARDSYIQAADKLHAQEIKKQENLVINQTRYQTALLSLEKDPLKAAQIAQQLREEIASNPTLQGIPTSTFASLMNDIIDIESGTSQFPSIGDEDIFADLYAKAAKRDISMEEINQARKNYDLTLNQFKTLTSMWRDQEDYFTTRSEREQKEQEKEAAEWSDKKYIEDIEKQIQAYLSPVDITGFGKDMKLSTNVSIMMNQELVKWRDEHGGQYPSMKEYLTEIADPILKVFGHSLNDITSYTPNTNDDLMDIDTVLETEKEEPKSKWYNPFTWGNDKEPETPTFTFTDEQSFQNLSTSFDSGYSKDETIHFLESMGEKPEAIQYYFDIYLNSITQKYLNNSAYKNDPVQGMRDLTDFLKQIGFTEEEISLTIKKARKE